MATFSFPEGGCLIGVELHLFNLNCFFVQGIHQRPGRHWQIDQPYGWFFLPAGSPSKESFCYKEVLFKKGYLPVKTSYGNAASCCKHCWTRPLLVVLWSGITYRLLRSVKRQSYWLKSTFLNLFRVCWIGLPKSRQRLFFQWKQSDTIIKYTTTWRNWLK